MVCAECMKMCCLGGKNSVVKGLIKSSWKSGRVEPVPNSEYAPLTLSELRLITSKYVDHVQPRLTSQKLQSVSVPKCTNMN